MTTTKQQMENRKRIDDLLSDSFQKKEGIIKINVGNTLQHELAKFFTCWELAIYNKQFYTEAIFKNGKRADIVSVDDNKIIEILHSEKEDNFKDYPLPIIKLKSIKVIEYWLAKVK